MKIIKRVLPKSLTGQVILLLLVAVFAAQAANLVFIADQRQLAIRAAARQQVLERTASVVKLLEETPPALHDQVLQSVNTRTLRFRLSPDSVVPADVPASEINTLVRKRLLRRLGDRQVAVRVDARRPDFGFPWRHHHDDDDDGWRHRGQRMFDDDDDDDDDNDKHRRRGPMGGWWGWPNRALELRLAVETGGGMWLNAETVLPLPRPPWGRALTWSVIVILILSGGAVVIVRRVTRPLGNLAKAAEAAGRGERPAPVTEEGPEDLRETIRSFNHMHQRLHRFVEDRTRLLAAISHDLRTPITTLRLRAEFIEDEETRRKVLETLDDMQRMAEATLDFAREEAAAEDTRTVDLAALIGSLCDDLNDIGQDVKFENGSSLPYACRPSALKRAIGNLIDNAVAYGERARVSVTETAEEILINVDDDGPGVADTEMDDVFKPFVRLEASRSRETGGIGLGLAIVRSIVRGHGGEVTLENRAEGGLRAMIQLPKAASTA